MYVTIIRTAGNGVAAYATRPAPDPLTLPPHIGAAQTVRLCPPDQIDRPTGVITAMRHTITVPRGFAAALAATRPATNLHGPLAAIRVNPSIGRLLAVGPFDQPADLDQWRQRRHNRPSTVHIVYLPIATLPEATSAGGGI